MRPDEVGGAAEDLCALERRKLGHRGPRGDARLQGRLARIGISEVDSSNGAPVIGEDHVDGFG